MSSNRHIINKQVIEIHLPKGADVQAIQKEVSARYLQTLVPIINEMCNRFSHNGEVVRIDSLVVDLGKIKLHELATAFTEKFSAALTAEGAAVMARNPEKDNQQPLPGQVELLAFYLATGTMPWWAASPTREALHKILDELLADPNRLFKALLHETALQKNWLNRFIYTFSASQVHRCIEAIAPGAVHQLPQAAQAMITYARNHPAFFPDRPAAHTIASTFWGIALGYAAMGNDLAGLIPHTIRQTLQTLGGDMAEGVKYFNEMVSVHVIPLHQNNTVVQEMQQQTEQLAAQHRGDARWQTVLQQVRRMLNHNGFTRLPYAQQQQLKQLLNSLQATANAGVQTVDPANLASFARQLDPLKIQLEQLQPTAAYNLLQQVQRGFNATDSMVVHNAGLVLLWPFLLRFFENLDLVKDRRFHDEQARHKAACILQYTANENEAGLFDGLLALNKVLCGITLQEPVVQDFLQEDEKEIAAGLLEAVITQGPNWKNLSVTGFRTAYLQREGLLRARDGHWLLQVKKETYDVTLEKLPWSFTTIKLPWMNDILLVEWM